MTHATGSRDPFDQVAEAFLERYRRGERPTVTEYVEKYPALAAQIRDLFPALLEIEAHRPQVQASVMPAGGAWQLPPQLGEYAIVREVGRGGMGIVYEAVQTALGRHVALKVLPPHTLLQPRYLERFRREARAAARLHHTNIVPVFGIGEDQGVAYYAMQFIQGQGLDGVLHEVRRLRDGPKPVPPPSDLSASLASGLLTGAFAGAEAVAASVAEPSPDGQVAASPSEKAQSRTAASDSGLSAQPEAQYQRSLARLGIQAAEALAYAHAQGTLHRDIKPANLLLDVHGTLWVTDFGLAKTAADENLTHTGDLVGTLRYMAPERFHGQCDARSDVYALGLTLYELLTKQPAFAAEDRNALIRQVTHEEPRRLRQLDPTIPRDLETIVHKAIDKEPGRRYATAAGLAADLQRFVEDRPIMARRISGLERAWRWARRNPVVAGLTAVVVLLLVLVAVATLVGYQRASEQRAEAERQERLALDAQSQAHRLAAEAEHQERMALDAQAEARQLASAGRLIKEEARRNLYAVNMRLAQQAWERGQAGYMIVLLEALNQREPEEEDLRGFEWHYLWRLAHPNVLTLKGHEDAVLGMVYSPDGNYLATASPDKTVKLWEAATGKEVRTFKGHRGPVRRVAFSPDGQRLASASTSDGTVRLWEVATGQELLTFKDHPGAGSIAFSPQGQLLASGGSDKRIRLWEAATGKVLRTLTGHSDTIFHLAFSPDGRRLASTGNQHGTVKVWEVDSGKALFTFLGHNGPVWGVAFSPDGQRIASAGEDQLVKVWEVAGGRELFSGKGHTNWLSCVEFSPDGQWVASGGDSIKVWEAATGKVLRTFHGHKGGAYSVAFSPDGQWLASSNSDKTVMIWDLAGGKDYFTIKGHTNIVWSVALSPDGQRLASASADRTVRLWDTTTGKELLTFRGHTGLVSDVAFHPNGQQVASASVDRTVQLWEAATGKELLTLKEHPGPVKCVAISPDGQRIASGSDNLVKLWETATGKELLTLKGHTALVSSVAFSPDGQRLASISHSRSVKLWDVTSGQELFDLPGHTSIGHSVAFSPDGKLLASGNGDHKVKLWDTTTGKEVRTLSGHGGAVATVAFSPDGRRLASSGRDQTIKLWETATGKELLSLQAHTSSVLSVTFSRDGRRLVSAGMDNTVKLWETFHVPTKALRARALREESYDLVESVYATHVRQADVIQALQDNPRLNEPLRQAALAVARQHPPDYASLLDASATVVRQQTGSAEAYHHALLQAEEACRLGPQNDAVLVTLGLAQYRVGQYQAAVETLTRAEALPKVQEGFRLAALAFLAMARHQLGQKEQALTTLDRLRESLNQPRATPTAAVHAWLTEAEILLEKAGPPAAQAK
jgi:WD40 repeat protein/serine/threonine protein kinase